MLWNAKMRFGKTLTSLQLVKNEAFQKVLIVTHRPVVADSWFDDFKKMKMSEAGYDYGSVNQGETLENLKRGETIYLFCLHPTPSIQWWTNQSERFCGCRLGYDHH